MGLKAVKSLVTLTLALLLSGCWDSRDINDKNIVLTVYVDRTDGGYSFHLSQLRQLTAAGGTQGDMQMGISRLSGDGGSLPEARLNLNAKSENPIYLGATRAVILGDGLTRNGIEEYINRLREMRDYRKSVDVVTSSTPPMDLLQTAPTNDVSVGFAIEDIITTLEADGTAIRVTLGEILRQITVGNIGLVLPDFGVEDKAIAFKGYSVIRNTKKVGFVPAADSQGIIFMLSDYGPRADFELPFKDNTALVRAIMRKREIRPSYSNGSVEFDADFDFVGEVQYTKSLMSLTGADKAKLGKELAKRLESVLEKQIKISQRVYKCDYLSFYRYFRGRFGHLFDGMDWNGEYQAARINVRVKASIVAAGMMDINPERQAGNRD